MKDDDELVYSAELLESIKDQIWCNGTLEESRKIHDSGTKLKKVYVDTIRYCTQCYRHFEAEDFPHYLWCELCGPHTELLVNELERLQAENAQLSAELGAYKREAAE